MCLAKIEQQFDPPQSEVREAWKAFLHTRTPAGRLNFPCKCDYIGFDTWKEAHRTRLLTDTNPPGSYVSGFHVFPTREDAENHWMGEHGRFPIYRVLVKGVRVLGKEDDSTVLVADWLLVPDPTRPTLEEMLALAEESWGGN